MKKAKAQMQKILTVLLAVVMLICAVPMAETAAWNGGGIYNNGLGGIEIDIYKYPYNSITEWKNSGGDPYGGQGCTWFVGARIMDLTNNRIGACISKGPQKWWNEYSVELGLHRDNTPSDYSIICWSGHVAILEKVEGSTAYISEGGVNYAGNYNGTWVNFADYDYCRLSTCDISSISGKNSEFLGYIHFGDFVKPKAGDIVSFGSYPQSEVTEENTDSDTRFALAAYALMPDDDNWKSYGYYSGDGISYNKGTMTPKDYMFYCDVELEGIKYRGVRFSEYRPYYTDYTTSDYIHSYQGANGYHPETVYWFKYEPLQWKVLDPNIGLVMCVSLIDSQAYNNYTLCIVGENDAYGETAHWGNAEKEHYANDYANSSLRQWLNETFYATAFTEEEQKRIITNENQNNDGYLTLTGDLNYPDYDSAPTSDKIFLLSYTDVLNPAYGLSASDSERVPARIAQGTDYAKCQGLYVYYGNSGWWLRTPGIDPVSTTGGTNRACSCGTDITTIGFWFTDYTGGVRPACKVANLSIGDIIRPEVQHTHTPGIEVYENVFPSTTNSYGSYDKVVYCTGCGAELNRVTIVTDPLPPTTTQTEPETKPATKPETSEPQTQPNTTAPETKPQPQESKDTENLNFFQRIIQWFRNLFDKLFGWIK